jgi:cytochrome P450
MTLEDLVGLDRSTLRCPHATYAQLREDGVRYAAELEAYVVSRYEDVVRVLLDHRTFSSAIATGRPAVEPGSEREKFQPLLLLADQPSHTQIRSIVNRAFTPARVKAWEPQVRALCDELIDGFADDAEVDFVQAFSGPLPIAVITGVMGVPQQEAPMFRHFSEQLTNSLGGHSEDPDAPLQIAREFSERIDPLITDAKGQVSEHILPVIAEAEEEGQLTRDQSIRFVMELIVAGNITTSHHLASSMLLLARDPDLADQLRQDPAAIPRYVEEALRQEAPIQGFYRLAREDAEVGGVPIPAGQRVFISFGAGNHDEDRWPEPAAMILEREQLTRHLAFGRGIHTCLGAPLARMEGRIAVERLLARFASIALAADVEDLDWHASFINHGPARVPLRLRAAEPVPPGR